MALEVGDTAPDFTVDSTNGEKFNLYSELKKRPILLNFYVGDFGINCTNYMAKFIESYNRISDLGVRMIPINPDSLDSHKLFKERLGAPFDYLFDKDGKIKYTWKAPIPKVLPELDEVVEGVKKAL